MTDSNLMPCPICGGEGVLVKRKYIIGERFFVACTHGGCRLSATPPINCQKNTELEAVETWNTRTPEQAVAATLGRRECEPKWTLQSTTQTQEFWRCDCGNCGKCFGMEDRQSFPFKITVDKVKTPNYCPNCGAKVVKR